MVTEEDVRNALRKVYDPEIGLDIVSLGLIYDIKVDGGKVHVKMTLTVPGCPLMNMLLSHAKRAVSDLEGVEDVNIELTFDPPWTPDRIDPEVRKMLGI